MYELLSKKIANYLLHIGVITLDKKEVCAFGLENIISRIFVWIYLFVIGFILNALLEAVLFYLTFLFMRKYAGGYHATTYLHCHTIYLFSFVVAVMGYRVIKNIYGLWWVIPIIAFILLTILLFSPIENPNNPIPIGKRHTFRINSIIIDIVFSLLVVALHMLNFSLSNFILITMVISAFFMYVEIIKRKKGGAET